MFKVLWCFMCDQTSLFEGLNSMVDAFMAAVCHMNLKSLLNHDVISDFWCSRWQQAKQQCWLKIAEIPMVSRTSFANGHVGIPQVKWEKNMAKQQDWKKIGTCVSLMKLSFPRMRNRSMPSFDILWQKGNTSLGNWGSKTGFLENTPLNPLVMMSPWWALSNLPGVGGIPHFRQRGQFPSGHSRQRFQDGFPVKDVPIRPQASERTS